MVLQYDSACALTKDADPAAELRETIACPRVFCRALRDRRIDDMIARDGVACRKRSFFWFRDTEICPEPVLTNEAS